VPERDVAVLLPWGISDVDAKKAMLGITSFAPGLFITFSAGDVGILKAANLTMPDLSS
jgi:hypothetical protein